MFIFKYLYFDYSDKHSFPNNLYNHVLIAIIEFMYSMLAFTTTVYAPLKKATYDATKLLLSTITLYFFGSSFNGHQLKGEIDGTENKDMVLYLRTHLFISMSSVRDRRPDTY